MPTIDANVEITHLPGPPVDPPERRGRPARIRHASVRCADGNVDAEERAVTYIQKPSAAADEVRRLAGVGDLRDRFRNGTADERRLLRAGAAEIAGPLVYERVTKPVERKRRHPQCTAAV